jgi:hypothetical protein
MRFLMMVNRSTSPLNRSLILNHQFDTSAVKSGFQTGSIRGISRKRADRERSPMSKSILCKDYIILVSAEFDEVTKFLRRQSGN